MDGYDKRKVSSWSGKSLNLVVFKLPGISQSRTSILLQMVILRVVSNPSGSLLIRTREYIMYTRTVYFYSDESLGRDEISL